MHWRKKPKKGSVGYLRVYFLPTKRTATYLFFTYLDCLATADTRRKSMSSESTTYTQWPNWQKIEINKHKKISYFAMLVKKTLTFHLLPNLPTIASLTPSLVKMKRGFQKKERNGKQHVVQTEEKLANFQDTRKESLWLRWRLTVT